MYVYIGLARFHMGGVALGSEYMPILDNKPTPFYELEGRVVAYSLYATTLRVSIYVVHVCIHRPTKVSYGGRGTGISTPLLKSLSPPRNFDNDCYNSP